MQLTTAMVQHPPVFLNLDASVTLAENYIREAATSGAELIVFPETWLPGYPVWLDYAAEAALWNHPPANQLFQLLVANSPSLDGRYITRLRKAAAKSGVYVIMGLHERAGRTLYNTTLYLSPDPADFAYHRKLIPTYTERLIWGRGDGSTLATLETKWGLIGGLICWEHWMPLARAAMHAKNEAIHIAQWPTVKPLHQLASRHYAFEGQCFVVAVGTVLTKGDVLAGVATLSAPHKDARQLLSSMPGEDSRELMSGGSCVIAPDSEYISEPVTSQAGIFYADIDLQRLTAGNLTLDTSGHYARPDIFQLRVDDHPQIDVSFRSTSND